MLGRGPELPAPGAARSRGRSRTGLRVRGAAVVPDVQPAPAPGSAPAAQPVVQPCLAAGSSFRALSSPAAAATWR
ncbi:hypothetical protein AHiyo8_65490 [Arthrobacter sp. Hiyo8]|nr:hypothetical protein AHiyo8_65490 [Arthrobacter sp. Hiyo8]